MHGGIRYPLHGSSIRKFWLLIKFLISFKVALNQAFFTSAGNLETSEKFMGSGMKCDTSDTYYPKLGNEFFNPLTTALNTLCKPLNTTLSEISATFH